METRVDYVTTATDAPEYHAAGLSLIAAELEVCRLREENVVLRDKYALALIVIRRMQERIGQLEARR